MEPRRKIQLYDRSPLRKGRGSSFEQTRIPFTQGCYAPSLVEIDPLDLEKKMRMWKVYDRNNDHNNDSCGQILIRKAHLSLWLRWAKKDYSIQSMAFSSYDIIINQHDWCNLIVNGNVIWISSVKHTKDFLSSFFWKENWTRDSETALKPDLSMLQYKT